MRCSIVPVFLIVMSLLAFQACVEAAVPSELLLPTTTKGYLSITDAANLSKKWQEMQLGQLTEDPVMKPFVDDFKDQLRAKLGQTGAQLGIGLEDLEGIPNGEISIAIIQPGNDKKQHALVLKVDVTSHETEARELLNRVTANQVQKGAQKGSITLQGIEVTTLKFAKKEDAEERHAYYLLHEDQFIVINHLETLKELIGRFDGKSEDTLRTLKPYAATMEHTQGGAESSAQIRWYVDPFGYVEVTRAMAGGRKKRGTDLLKVLANQGFTAVKGLGGAIFLADGKHELLHRTFVYAPKVDGKYKLAARILDFPNTEDHEPLNWIPRDLAGHMTMNMRIKEAFEHLGSLVDEFAGDQGVWADVLESIKNDPNGPQVDLRNELVRFAGERITVVTDYRLPIGPKSERIGVAIQVTDEAAVAKALDKIMEADPNARKHEIDGRVIWEIINEQAMVDVPDIEIEGAGFASVANESEKPQEEEEKHVIPNSAATVFAGQLLISTHVDFIRELVQARAPEDTLSAAADYQVVNGVLGELGASSDSFRYFTRTDEAYRPTYELLRQGKMPESETMLGRVLNKLMAPDEEGTVREQQLDGAKLPPYDAVRRYLGPAGFYTRSEVDGWTIIGCLLKKEIEQAAP